MNFLVFLTRLDLFGCELQLGLCAISIMFPKKSLHLKETRCFIKGLESKKDRYSEDFLLVVDLFLLQDVTKIESTLQVRMSFWTLLLIHQQSFPVILDFPLFKILAGSFYNVKNASSIITSKSSSKNLCNENKHTLCFQRIGILIHVLS